MQHIGFIGLGIMGKPMAINLLRAGFPVSVYARRAEVAEPLIAEGATTYPSPQELAASGVDIIIIIVPTTADVEDVINGKKGILQAAKPGCIVIDMSTISASATQRFASQLAKKQVEMLDAPVSGGEKGAIEGTLSIMVGGKANILEKVRPILKKLGKQIVHIGDHGAGQIAKSCNQILIAETILAVSEALTLAKASGLDPARVREALLGGFAHSCVLEVHGQRMLDNDYKPGFKSVLHRKDLHLALEQAHQVGIDLPRATEAMHSLDRLVLKGHGELDSSALHLLVDE